ncbi:MAG TPA: hypothetical protein VM369_09165 [Candidatus Binatia bacterium]|nr:hypothetical protein [Candidatus Binatia bacterium]
MNRLFEGGAAPLRRAALALGLALAVCGPAQALELSMHLSRPYVGVRAGVTRFAQSGADLTDALQRRGNNVTATVDRSGAAGVVYAGVPIGRFTALELGFADLGDYDIGVQGPDSGSAQLRSDLAQLVSPTGQALLLGFSQHLPMCGGLWLQPRASLLYYRSKQAASSGGVTQELKRHGGGFDLGAALMLDLGRAFTAGVGVEAFKEAGFDSLWLLSGQLQYSFGSAGTSD